MVELYRPEMEDMWFRQQMMEDEATMAYNHAWGGTIPFPQERWEAWYDRWVRRPGDARFYRYVVVDGVFVGEAAYHYDEESQLHLADVIIHASFRGRGYGRAALGLLCDAAAEHGIARLWDSLAIDNGALGLFQSCGFEEMYRTEAVIMVKKELKCCRNGI